MADLLKVSFTGINLHIDTKSLILKNRRYFEQLLKFSKCNNVESFAINHSYEWSLDFKYQDQRPWSLDELKLISKHFPISEICVYSLHIDSANFADFKNLFSTMGKFYFLMDCYSTDLDSDRYLFCETSPFFLTDTDFADDIALLSQSILRYLLFIA